MGALSPRHDCRSLKDALLKLKRAGSKATYTAHLIDDNSGVGTQVMATDVNGDGKPDVVAANKRGVFIHTRK